MVFMRLNEKRSVLAACLASLPIASSTFEGCSEAV
jgi:hypothetical protein